MIPMRKVYEVVGYAQDGACYCADCWKQERDMDGPDAEGDGPVFLQDADDLTCDACGDRLDGDTPEDTDDEEDDEETEDASGEESE